MCSSGFFVVSDAWSIISDLEGFPLSGILTYRIGLGLKILRFFSWGVLSRGICRRFIKYVGACSDSFSYHEGLLMAEEDVRRVVTSEVVSRDIDLELSSFLGDSERVVAVKALEVLGEVGEINQKGLAAELDASEATLGRVLRKLERMGWVTRSRGERKELRVRLTLS